jgi:hypothetical protein
MNRKMKIVPFICFLMVTVIAACSPVASQLPPTPQVIQQTVVVVITATPPENPPTPLPVESTATGNPQPTTAPTALPSPTPLNLLNIPIEGGDGDKMFFARLVFPDYGQAATTSLVFQVLAHSPLDAAKDGEGIDSVDFRIEDQDGNEVHHRVEKTAHYCAFSGGEPDCLVWDFAKNNYKWPNGVKIESGTFTIFINVTSKDNVNMNGKADFRIKLP